MHAITVLVGQIGWSLLFKDEEKANKVAEVLKKREGPFTAIEDDFGQKLDARTDAICGFMIEDMEQSKLAHVERALHQQRTQNLAQKTAEADPSLRLNRMMNGPAMISPMMPGQGRN